MTYRPTEREREREGRDGMRERGRWNERGSGVKPNGGTLMGKELYELGYEDIERSVQSIRVQLIIAVLTDLVESRKRSLVCLCVCKCKYVKHMCE